MSAMKDPYLANLAKQGSNFTNFSALYHPSYPNYLAMIAGNSFGVRTDSQKTFPADVNHLTIGDLLDWKNYAEDYPLSPQPFLGSTRGKYARKHVPFLSFSKVQRETFMNVISIDTHNPNNAFILDVASCKRTPDHCDLPRYMFYSPNLDDDGHDPVLNPRKGLQKASAWLENFLTNWFPPDVRKGTLTIITFDEAEPPGDQSNHIYTIFLGDMVRREDFDDPYNHYDILKTIEQNFGLPPLNSGDKAAAGITDVWSR
jgi:Phosphoesterase family